MSEKYFYYQRFQFISFEAKFRYCVKTSTNEKDRRIME